jgi:histidinol-phosphate phosphatase family protein
MNSGHLTIDRTWTLFLDRDGVINRRIVDGYVRSWDEFEFLPGVPQAIKVFSGLFGNVIVVSNQQGVGKGLMTDSDVISLHKKMAEELMKAGGKIDRVYYCPDLKEQNSIMRKPNVGMALKARKDFPAINFRKSVMAGDSLSDMVFGKRLKMTTVLLTKDVSLVRKAAYFIDYFHEDLSAFASDLSQTIPPPSTHSPNSP